MTLVSEKIKNSESKKEVIISVKNLRTYYPILGGIFRRKMGVVKAVDGVSFDLYKRETLGLVGESGCGKTTIGNTILNLVPATSGEIYYKEERIDNNFTKDYRKKIQMVFQDPDSSLNPRWKVVDIIGEPLRILLGMKKRREVRRRVLDLLETVSMKVEHLDRYPHEFSGGQKQRIVIARALACSPEVIILDEPTSALDVSVQAQILNLLKDLQNQFDLSYLFITHDLSVIQHIGDRIEVMYLGKFVEEGATYEIFNNPIHPYTRALLSARPTFDPTTRANRIILEGEIPSPINPPSGCYFHPRCPECSEQNNPYDCCDEEPIKISVSETHYMWCTRNTAEKCLPDEIEYTCYDKAVEIANAFVPINYSNVRDVIPPEEAIIYSTLCKISTRIEQENKNWTSHVLMTPKGFAYLELKGKNSAEQYYYPWWNLSKIKKNGFKIFPHLATPNSYNFQLINDPNYEIDDTFIERKKAFPALLRPIVIKEKKARLEFMQINESNKDVYQPRWEKNLKKEIRNLEWQE